MADERVHSERTETLEGSEDARDESREASTPRSAEQVGSRHERAIEQVPARYEVLRVLGAGGSAVVLEARDRKLGRRVALKVLDLKRDGSARLLREARAVASLEHPAVVRVYEVDVDHGVLVLELLEGGTLSDRIARGTLSRDELIELGSALSRALAAAHRAGLLHRDVKPSNVLLDGQGKPRLADFGIAAVTDAAFGADGTRAYAAPEQLRGQASVASDLYGLGATLLRAATGKHARELEGRSPEEVVREATGSAALARVIAGLLEADPARRPSSADAVASALEAARQPRTKASLLAVVLVAVSLAVAFGLSRGPSHGSEEALVEARAALDRNDLDGAQGWLARADAEDPRAIALSALLDWWRGLDAERIVDRLDRALAGGLPPSDRQLIEGLRLLGRHELDAAAAHFDAEVARHPSARSALYGAFEAHWHRGEGAVAADLYDRIVLTDPDFALGIEHVLVQALAARRFDRVSRILAGSDAVPTAERVLWSARLDLARGDPTAARDDLERALRLRPDVSTHEYVVGVWVQAEVALRDVARARDVAERANGANRALLRHALATLEAGADLGPTRRSLATLLAEHPTGSYVTSVGWLAIELALGERGELSSALAAFERVRHDDVRTRMIDLLVAERRDPTLAHPFLESTSPEVVAAAQAIEAEANGALATAAASWERASEASNDGTLRPLALARAAALHRRAGQRDRALADCEASSTGLLPLGAFPLIARCDAWALEGP